MVKNRSDLKAVVDLVAIQAKLLAAGEPDPVGSGGFSTAVAYIGIKQPRFFRQGNRSDYEKVYFGVIMFYFAFAIGEYSASNYECAR